MASPGYFSDANKKSEVNELKTLFDQADTQRDPKKYKQVVQKVIACMTLGMDMSSLFMRMIKAGATNDLIQKKLVYLYICAYAKTNTQLAVLTVNTLLKDIQDSNSMIRGLALRSMTSLNLPDLLEYIEDPLIASLQDPSHYVRRTAVMGCVKLHHLNPDFVEAESYGMESKTSIQPITVLKVIAQPIRMLGYGTIMAWQEYGVIDKLKKMILDADPQVVCNCTFALDEILAAEGGLMVDQSMAYSLLKRLKSMNEWCQCQVLDLLTRYTPPDEQEIYDILNLIDARLKHPNAAVVMATIKLFFHLAKDNQDLMNDVLQRIKAPLISMMSSSNYEVIYTALCHIKLLLSKIPQLFDSEYKIFFLRLNDPLFLRRKKVQILTIIASQSNVEEIVTELSELVYDIDIELCQECIKAIGKIAHALPKAAEYCIDTLLGFLSREIESITGQTLIVIRDLLPQYEKYAVAVLPQLKECIEIVENPHAKAAIVWILGEYGQCIPESPYILETLVNTIEEEQSAEVKLQLLTAMMKLFFKKPPECQATLGILLAYCIEIPTTPSYKEDQVQQSATSQPDVTVGNLLGDLHVTSPAKTDKESKLKLVAHPFVSRSDFQQKWIALRQSSRITMDLDRVPTTPNEFEETLLSQHIIMMAYNSSAGTTQKYFHYAQQEEDSGLFFIETNINEATNTLTAVFKGEVEERSAEFVNIYTHAVTGKWMTNNDILT
ncbi:hypothetical protein QZH41_013529 [Actinostola sp. cb2023]|nr:hypothetical protein QZH41_013529 [Actinostola sp. cb2023]